MARVFLILNQPELELNGFRGQSIQLTFGLSFTLTTTHEPVDYHLEVTRSIDLTTWSINNVALHSTTVDHILYRETRVYLSTIPYDTLPREFLRAGAVTP